MDNCSRAGQIKKPRQDFPLFPHRNGRWCKKVRYRHVYFERIEDDPKGSRSLDQWLDQKDDLPAGRKPKRQSDELMLKDLVNLRGRILLGVQAGFGNRRWGARDEWTVPCCDGLEIA